MSASTPEILDALGHASWEEAASLLANAPTPTLRWSAAEVASEPAAGQTGIAFRRALLDRDAAAAAQRVAALDPAHHIELLLGEALRDARHGFLLARLYLVLVATPGPAERRWWPFLRLLCDGEPDHRLDDAASAWVAARIVPDRWSPGSPPRTGLAPSDGAPLTLPSTPCDDQVAAALARGVSGLALLDALAGRPLHPPVAWYYRVGTIHALGPRPLLVLAAAA